MIKRFYILLLAIVASVGMSWATDPIVIYTNTGQSSYTQGDITITCSKPGDSDGFYLEKDGNETATITNLGSSTISQIELEIGWFPDDRSYVRANGVEPSSSSDPYSITFSNVNSNNVALTITNGKIQIRNVTITLADEGGSTPTGNSITINASSHGSVVASPTSAEAGETITLTATPDDGYQLKSISGVYVPRYETLNATSETVNGNKFQAQATAKNNYGWRVYNPGTANTLTVSSLNGTTLITKIEFTSTWGNSRENNMLSVSKGTLSFDESDPSTTVTINDINATSVTISGSGTNNAKTWCISSVKVYTDEEYDEEELEISDTENANVKTFTMVDSEVTISAEFEAVAPAPAAGVTWNSSNISDLQVNGNSYSKEGVTLSPNAGNNYAYWLDYGNESQNGIYFYVNATGGHTFSNSLGKNFTKIEMTLNGLDGWASANLGSGWNIDGMKAIWTGNASTVDLLKETSSFGGAAGVKSIVFYFEGGSEEPGGGSTPAGALNGAFTVNSGGSQVYFSRGNLQATTTDLGASWTWGFAANQYDCVGNAVANNSINGNGTVSANGTVDMFGWSTSANYYGINNSQDGTDYAGDFKDWGETIDDGWRTLTFAEWRYLLEQRDGTRYCKATVNSKTGLVIFPDNYSHPAGVTDVASANTKNADFATNSWSGDDWTNMETAGAVFLPMAGCRFGTSFMFQSTNGFYWSSTPYSYESGQCYRLNFKSTDMDPASWYARYGGMFVRLVYNAPIPAYEAAINLINEIPNPAVLTAECKAKVDAARAAYNALSDGDKDLVTNIATLTTAEAAFENVMNIWLSGDCDVILWNDTTLTVRKHAGEGNGAMADYNYASRAPWYSAHWNSPQPNDIVIKSVTIENGVTHLGDYAFAWMSEMKTVTIPSSVTTIPDDAFYWSKAVDDIYLHTNPSDLMWVLPTSADVQFKPEKATLCHVPVDLLPRYQQNFSNINVTYVGDQAPTIPTLEVGLTLNAMDEFYLGPDTTCFQFSCFSAERYFFGKGSFRIKFESPAENVHTMLFQPKQQGTDVMMMYRNGETFVTYGTNCCATALPASATVIAGDGTKANPFVLEPDTKGDCVQAEFTTLPQAVSEITYDGEPHTLIAAGVSTAGTVQYSLDNGASWSADLPQGTDPVTYTVHYRVISAGNACIQGIDYDPNNKVTASIVSPAVKDVKDKIAAIGTVTYPASGAAIEAARAAYDALDDNLKPFVENYSVLTDAEAAYAVIALIAQIPNPMTAETTKLSVYTKTVAAREAFDALTPAQQAVVSNIARLTDAEDVFNAIASSGGSGETVIQWDKNTGIAYVSPTTTSPAYEHMTVTTGNGSSFSVFMQARLSFGFNSQPNGGFTFANVDGYNLTKVEIKSTTALTSTMQEVDRMGSGWAISDDYKTATWAGNADSVSIWKGQSFTNYWYSDTILFTIATPSNPIMNAFAAVDKINLIPDPVTLEDACVNAIKDARAAVDSLYAHKSLIDDPDMLKLTNAEAALKDLNQAFADPVIAKINNIPQPVELKLATRDSIQNARAAYDALTADQKPLVTNYQILLDAEEALAAINPGGAGMPAGALSGKFAINAEGDQIAFAKGNLQARTEDLGETWTWGFAAHQWEVIGNAAANNAVSGNKTVSTNGTVDLFGWSTPMTYYGIHNSTNSDYYSDDFREWGENITGATWKTLSPSDWSYIIYDRADAADKQGQATVNGVNGYIFLPDEWELPSGLSFTAKPNNWTANVYDGDDWTAMENAGAVFLPKSPWRSGNTVNTLTAGYYWSSDYNSYSQAMAYAFQEDASIKGTGINRFAGIPVRLVTAEAGSLTPLDSAQAVKDLIDAISVPVTLNDSDAIQAARAGYEALAELTKGALDAATVQKLTDAEDAYAALIQAATDVIALINAIPQPVVYNEACGDSISAARNAYDALSDELKPLVTNYQTLTDAEDTYAALAPRIWTSGDCQVLLWPGDSAMIVSKLPGEGNGVMDNYATKNDVPWKEYQLAVKTLTIESGVTEIGKCAFYDLRNLAGDLVIPEGVTAIHENGFRNCLKLTSITLPSTITLLGDEYDAFNNCKAANIYITADPNTLAWNEDNDDFIYSYAQQDVHKTTVCHVPADYYEIYVAKFDQTVNVTFVGDLPNALSEAEHQAIDAVKDSIAAIGAEISYPASGAAIDAARSAYDALDDDLKPFVSNYQTLLDAEDAYADAKQAHDAVAYAAIDKINAIPVPVEYSSKAAIDTARVAYDALLDTQKALVSEELLQKLTDAEATWAAIAAKVEHNVTYIGKEGELKNEIVALLNIPEPAPDFNGYEFVRWDVKAGDFLEEGLRIKAVYTPIITTNPQGFDTLAYNGLAQELVAAGVAKEGHIEYSLYPEEPESWSAELPTAINAGVYAIYYKLVREGHDDYIAPEPTMATIAKVPVTYVAPIAYDTLTYNYNAQTLIVAGQTLDGTFEYTLDPTDDQNWSTELPQGMNAGLYGVNFRVIGDMNHFDSIIPTPIEILIAKRDIIVTAPAAYDTLVYNAKEQTLAIDGTADFNKMEYTLTPNDDNSWFTVMPTAKNTGSYDIYYRVPGDANHNDYAPQNITAAIAQAPLTITAVDSTIIYGDEAPEFIASYSGWQGEDNEEVVSGLAYTCTYEQGSYVGTYAIQPNSATSLNYAITFVDGTLTVNKAHVYVSDAEAQIAKFADGHANAVVLKQGTLNGIKLNDPIAHITTAAFSSADVAENLTITLFYELTGDAALLNNYYLEPTSDIFTNEGVIIEPFIPDNEEKPEDEEATVNEGIEIYAYGYCDGSGYSLKYHLESGNPDQYKIDFEDSRFTDIDWTNLVITGKDGTIDIEIPVDLPTGDYSMTVYFRDSRFDWLESRQFNVTFHVNLPETYVRPLFDNVIALVDTCHCLTDIQWYWRANSTDLWQPIEGANGYYYHVDGKLTGEYFVSAKMNGEPTYTCGQADMETLYGAGQQAEAPVVRAYPNPVVNSTTVTIENSIEWIHNIRIVNLMGAEVMNDTFEGNETNVEMGNYPQGNYMISVDGIVVKVMKQ